MITNSCFRLCTTIVCAGILSQVALAQPTWTASPGGGFYETGVGQQSTLTTVPIWDGSQAPPPGTSLPYQTYNAIGGGVPTTFGEIFTDPLGDTSLNSFTFYLQGTPGTQNTFLAEVFNWNGGVWGVGTTAGTTGAPLAQQTIVQTYDGGWDAVTVNIPGGAAVTPGNNYVIDFTGVGGDGTPLEGNTWLGDLSDSGNPFGGFDYSNPPGTEYGPWVSAFGFYGDLAFTANFSPVPEPSTIIAGATLLLPFGASLVRMFRKKITA